MTNKKHPRSKPYKHPKTKHWSIQFSRGSDTGGKRDRKTITGRTKAEVIARADAYEKTLQPYEPDPTGYTLASYIETWFAAKRNSWKPRTKELYRHQIDHHIVPSLGPTPLEQVTPLDVQRMVTKIVDSGHVPTANKCRRLLFSALKQAVRWDILAKNPVEAVDPVREDSPEMTLWTPAQARTFLAKARSHRLYAAYYLMIASGLRRAEVLGLRWEDVRSDGVSIEQTLVLVGNQPAFGTPKTKRSRRYVALDQTTLDLLADHKARQGKEREACGTGWQDHHLVFSTEIGTPLHPRNFLRLMYRLCREAGVPKVSLHSLRHLHTSLLIARGQDPKSISDRLGHSSTSFTLDRYGHIFNEHRARSALPLDELLGDSEEPDEN